MLLKKKKKLPVASDSYYPDMKLTKALQAIVRACPEGARVLDLGCGNGRLLAALRDQKGCITFGVENSPAGAELCQSKGLDVRCANVDDYKTDDELRKFILDDYDVICCTKALEYFSTKNELLTDISATHFIFQHNNMTYWKRLPDWLRRGKEFALNRKYGEFIKSDGEIILCTPRGFIEWGRSYGYEANVIYGGHIFAGAVVIDFCKLS